MKVLIVLALISSYAMSQPVVSPMLMTAPVSAPSVTFGRENINTLASSSASHTLSLTITDADLIVVCINSTWAAPTGVTFNSDACTEQTARENSGYGSFIYTRANPDVGTYNVVVSWSGATDATVTAFGWKKTHNTTPVVTYPDESEGVSTTPSLTLSSATGSVVVDCLGWYNWITTATADGSQTQLSNQTYGDIGGAVSTKPGAASVTMNWTLSNSREWAQTAIYIVPE